MNYSFIYNNPTKIFFGVGKLEIMSSEPLPGKKALLLTSKGKSHFLNGAFDKTTEQLKKANVDYVHLGIIEENPLKEHCEYAGKFAFENDCDFIVALGGGAVLDSAVAVSIMATNSGDLWDYVDGGSGKGMVAPNSPLPIVTIPTTSGTGSEINECGVISRADTNEKVGMADRRCKPKLAIVDPLYMRSVPASYTAFQGFDAFFHHEEVMLSKKANVMSETIALKSIELLYEYLPIAVLDGNNIEAREKVAFASTMSGITMQLTRITAQHSIEHAMSAIYRNLPHGAGLIMISDAFANHFIKSHSADEIFMKMAQAMGRKTTNNPNDFLDALKELKIKCGVESLKMSDYGIDNKSFYKIPPLARKLQRGGFEVTPSELSDEDIIDILENSYK